MALVSDKNKTSKTYFGNNDEINSIGNFLYKKTVSPPILWPYSRVCSKDPSYLQICF